MPRKNRADNRRLADLDVDVSDEVVPEVVADVHLGYFPELAELLENLLEKIFELFSRGGVEWSGVKWSGVEWSGEGWSTKPALAFGA